MKTVVCGFGKCGSRMVLDLHALIYGGKYSCQLNISKNNNPSIINRFLNFFSKNVKDYSMVKNIHKDEIPHLHMGDPDNQNEVINMCRSESEDARDTANRKTLIEDLVDFNNWSQACGQYHIIGEQVMKNLITTNPDIKKKVVDSYINKNSRDNVSTYFLMFSAGGGSGCGTSTVLSEIISQRAKEQFANMLVAGIAVLPGAMESPNFKISTGRFLTKFLSSERATSFDTVFTVSNSIMEEIEDDASLAQTRANIFAAQLVCSLINSSSKYHRSPINTDGPELRKNIHGLSYFCFAQNEKSSDYKNLSSLDLLAKALSPVSAFKTIKKEDVNNYDTFQGVSIRFDDNSSFTSNAWSEMIEKIKGLKDEIQHLKKDCDLDELKQQIIKVFPEPKIDLPLAMRSCENVVVLRGIPESGKSSSWEQSVLVTILEVLFPKATIHYYYTYHTIEEETLTLIPSNYINFEVINNIEIYLKNVWKEGASCEIIRNKLYGKDTDYEEKAIQDLLGDREHFEYKFIEFIETCERLSGKLGLSESDWEESYITSSNVAAMMSRINKILEFIKQQKIVVNESLPVFDL